MSESLSIDQRNYRRVTSDLNHARYQHKRIKEQLDTLAAELVGLEDDIASYETWLGAHQEFETPDPYYTIRNSVAVDEKEQAWNKSDQ